MVAINAVSGSLADEKEGMAGSLFIPLAYIMTLAFAAIGGFHILLWLSLPSFADVVNTLAMAVLTAVGLGSILVARSNRPWLAPHLLIWSLVAVVTIALVAIQVGMKNAPPVETVASGMGTSMGFGGAVALAGLLLSRRAVFGVAAAVCAAFLLQSVLGALNWPALAQPQLSAILMPIFGVLGLIFLLALLASEYSRHLGILLSRSESRARELEQAKAEIERKMAELQAAKEEIERKRDVSLSAAARINEMAREMATAAAEQASGSSQQAAAMSQIVATMEEMSRAAAQIAGNSVQVSQLASTTLHTAEAGRSAVEETIAALDRIRGEMRSVAEKNLALGQKTQAIGEIIEVITEIADRTHLLSLNAAIESAAAGEYGRRFSVVASQVKELANESKNAAHQVRTAVAEIQRASASTVLAAEKGEAEVEAGVRLGRGAGESIVQMVASIEGVAVSAKEMLLATQQQQSASEQVVNTIREIEQVTRQSAEGSRQTSRAVSQLVAVAEQLR